MAIKFSALRTRTILVIYLALTLAGCARFEAMSRVDPQTVAYYNPGSVDPAPDPTDGPRRPQACPLVIGTDRRTGAINLDCFYFPEETSGEKGKVALKASSVPAPNKKLKLAADKERPGASAIIPDKLPMTAYQRVVTSTGADQLVYRNRLIAVLIKHADDICTVEMGRLIANEATTKAALTTLDSVFSTASTIVSGVQAKSILSGISGVANTGRATVEAEIYRNSMGSAITRSIATERTRLLGLIQQKLRNDYAGYTVDQGIVDVNEYHQVCSLYRGLELVNDAVDSTRAPTVAAKAALDAIAFLDAEIAQLQREKSTAGDSAASYDAPIAALQAQRTTMVKRRVDVMSGIAAENAPVQPAKSDSPKPAVVDPPKNQAVKK